MSENNTRPLTELEKATVKTLDSDLARLRPLVSQHEKELMVFREMCSHPDLPKRSLGEEYRDYCPDCGFCRYAYRM